MTYEKMQDHAHFDADAGWWVDNDDPDFVWGYTGAIAGWQPITRELAEDFQNMAVSVQKFMAARTAETTHQT